MPVGRHVLGSFPQYEQAQALVDYLSDNGFPVETVTIVGADLRLVERVTGRMTRAKAALAGAASGAWVGLLLGLFIALFATSGTAFLLLVLYGLLLGVLWGAVLGFVAHAATRGQRDFSSITGLAASSYEVMVDETRAGEAERLVAQRGGV
jgi:hypothetical protein